MNQITPTEKHRALARAIEAEISRQSEISAGGAAQYSHDIEVTAQLIAQSESEATAQLREALEKIQSLNRTAKVLNVSVTMAATEQISTAALNATTAGAK